MRIDYVDHDEVSAAITILVIALLIMVIAVGILCSRVMKLSSQVDYLSATTEVAIANIHEDMVKHNQNHWRKAGKAGATSQ